MPRKPRIDYPGAWHHVMHRGARREPIFHADEHCGLLLGLVKQAVHDFEIQVHGYALMPNHYHFLIRSMHGNLSKAMQFINGEYTQRLNIQHHWDGPVFRGRFKSELIRDESTLPYVLAYIHLNPLRAHLVPRIDSECWSGHRSYLGRRYAPEWVETGYFLERFGSAAKLQEYLLALHRGKLDWHERLDLETGMFREASSDNTEASSAQPFQSRFVEPEALLNLVCQVTGATIKHLQTAVRGRGANPSRRFAVIALVDHTSLTQKQIGQELKMSPSQVANVLQRRHTGDQQISRWKEILDDKV